MMRSFALVALLVSMSFSTANAARVQEPKEFDRLDGKGASGKKVDVIEWEGNLEIHVYPKGGLKSLGMKIDHKSETTKDAVMVIEYAFNGVPHTLIRRAVLSVKMPDRFFAHRDPSAKDYDKIIVSGTKLANYPTFPLAPGPTQLYPDFHPSLEVEDAAPSKKMSGQPSKESPAKNFDRKAASEQPRGASKIAEPDQDQRGTTRRRQKTGASVDEDGAIRHFAF